MLILEDDPSQLKRLTKKISKFTTAYTQAESMEQAMRLLESKKYDFSFRIFI